MKHWALVLVLLCSHGLIFANTTNDLQQSIGSAKQQRQELSARIVKIQKEIDAQLKQRKTADAQLQKTESAISDLSRQLNNLEKNQKETKKSISELVQQQNLANKELKQLQEQLAKQLRAQYQGRLSAWSVLLSGDDPNEIGRNLAYIEYVHKHQALVIESINSSITKIKKLQQDSKNKDKELQKLIQDISLSKNKLDQQKQEHAIVLKKIDTDLKVQRKESKVLEQDHNRLGDLILNIQTEIDIESKKMQLAEEKKLKQEKQLEQEKQLAQKKQTQGQTKASKKLLSAPAGSMLGLEKNLLKPVNGEVLGRFGASRPEGGVWRGIVIRSPSETPVKSVAPGQVVYANWLAGFGNILIIDHGSQFLSVYAYNHSLLKQIGDKVAANDIIATVGATGGQVEPGLYFEIRENGKPINPTLWLIQ